MALRIDSGFIDDITNVARVVNSQGGGKPHRREHKNCRAFT